MRLCIIVEHTNDNILAMDEGFKALIANMTKHPEVGFFYQDRKRQLSQKKMMILLSMFII